MGYGCNGSVGAGNDPPPIDLCAGITCTGHGTCAVTSADVAICACDQDYHAQGLDCVSDLNPCDNIDCSLHGTCQVSGDTAWCDCDADYHAEGLACVADPVAAAPTVSLAANPTTVDSGGTSTLTWSTTHATSCTASGAWSGSRATAGNETTGAITTVSTFTLTCAGPGGTSSRSAVVAIAGESLTTGYDHSTRSVTSPVVVLDLAQPSAGNYPVWVSGVGYPNLIRAATHELNATGGYFGRGFSRFSPGDFADGHRGEHYCGVGQIHGFDGVGDSSRMVVGQLVRFGTSFFTDQMSLDALNGDIKEIILINDTGARPMIITKGGATRVLAACDGTVCNTKNTVEEPYDWFNDGGHQPDINAYLGEWLWVELAFNSNVPFTRVRTWSADGVLQGAETIAPWASPGRVTTLDVIGFVNSIPTPGAQPYYDLERVEFRVGTDENITPPHGFPGSAR